MSIPPTHYRSFAIVGAALLATGLLVTTQDRFAPPQTARATASAADAIPEGALLLLTADLARLRATGFAERLRAESRDVPGLGDIREVCGFDPLESFDGAAFAIPAGGADGDFGIAVRGDRVGGDQLLACTTKVIAARGGSPLASKLGSFDTVRDIGSGAPAGEIGARPGGPFLLGAGSYLRSMVDAADGRVPSIAVDGAHARLATALSGAPVATATLVLGPRQRATIAEELVRAGSGAPPAIGKVAAVGVGLEAQGDRVGLHVILACDDGRAALEVANALEALRLQRADSPLARLSGIGSVLAAIQVEVERDLVHARLVMTRPDAEALVDVVLAARPGPALPAGRVTDGAKGAASPASAADAPASAADAPAAPNASAAASAPLAKPKKKKPVPSPSRDELHEF